jgi:hypothetical protein
LELFVDGDLAARSTAFAATDYDLTVTRPLRIGFGAHDYFRGRLVNIRLYQGALSPTAIRDQFAKEKPLE